ncbi:MAG TPA: DUF1841 family protein [Woeseiaceae bacterium]|nr:DUF1841 family protein [Woeseiaceae bacterium]
MIFSNDRDTLRKMYRDAWQKKLASLPMSPLEVQITDVIELHPEYHSAMEHDDLDRDYTPDRGRSNPFLHMGLHLGLREQIATNRPAGISAIFRNLAAIMGDAHRAEHEMIECLAETLWAAQSANAPPDEQEYLGRLQRLLKQGRQTQ